MILVFSAHADDEVLGCGGSIAKFAEEGQDIVSIIFTADQILFDPKYILTQRQNESLRSSKVLGIRKTIFMGVEDSQFSKQIKSKGIQEKVKRLILKYKPTFMLTHSKDDPHPAHISVANLIKKTIDELKLDTPLYTFNNNLPLRLIHRDQPRLFVDITDTYKTKRKALSFFKSQEPWLRYYGFIDFLKSKMNGIVHHCAYAEVFHQW